MNRACGDLRLGRARWILGQKRFLVEDRDAFEPSLEERAAGVVLAIGQAREWFFQIDSLFAVERAFAQQESASHTPRDAVIPAGYGRVDEMCAGHRHGWISIGG
jgi:hypothetical protein